MNKPAYIMLDSSITVFVDGKPTTINSSHPNFSKVKDAIFNAQYDKIVGLLSIEDAISNMSSGKIKVSDGRIFYGNTQIHGVVVNKLLEMLKAGAKDVQPLVSFIERLMANPSANSVDQLYTFLSYKSLPITSTGKFLAYKGVKNDFYSKNGNSNTVVVCGKVNQASEIYNGVGETIEVARNSVTTTRKIIALLVCMSAAMITQTIGRAIMAVFWLSKLILPTLLASRPIAAFKSCA